MGHALKDSIAKIASISDKEFESILGYFTTKAFKKHEYVIQQGMPVINDFFVITGCLKGYMVDEYGKEHIMEFAIEGWWISDYMGYFNRRKAMLNVDCIEDCELLALSLDNRQKLCSDFDKMDQFFNIKFNDDYARLQKRIGCVISQSAESKYHYMVNHYPELVQRIPKKDLASYLGLSRETLSRL